MSIVYTVVDVLDVLAFAARHGVSIALGGDCDVLVHAPPMGSIPDEVRQLIRAHRDDVVQELERRRTTGDHPSVVAWLCVRCQQRYPGPSGFCKFCRRREE